MTKYSEIESQTAENLLKEGYKWLTKNSVGTLYACKKITPVDDYTIVSNDFVPIFKSIESGYKSCIEPVSLESIVHPQILDDAERRYLKGVIRPFRKSVRYIEKKFVDDGCEYACCYLLIQFADARERMEFPTFFEKDMYKGMETYKKYTLEELGL